MNIFLSQQFIVFSDGSSLVCEFKAKKNYIKYLDKDLKNFQKIFKEKSLHSSTNYNSVTNYRKKLFK